MKNLNVGCCRLNYECILFSFFYGIVLYNNTVYFTLFSDVAVWSEEYVCYLKMLDCWFPIDGNAL